MLLIETKAVRPMQKQLDLDQAAYNAQPIEIVEPDAIVLFCDQRITMLDARFAPAEEQYSA